MNNKVFANLTLALAALFFVLVCVSTYMNYQNRQLQTLVNSRQVYINQTAQFTQIYQSLVQTMAQASLKNSAIKDILNKAGLTVTYRPNAPESSGTAAEAPKK